MKLIQCTVKGFGKLHEATFDFNDGLNVFMHENGWGKTTLSMFLKAMLYGLSENRKKDLSENERVRYLPWDASISGGALVYESGGRTYRVERTFSKKSTGADDTCTVYDATTGEILPIEGNLGETLFGIDADGFERTVFLSERALSGKNENKSIAAKLSDLVGTDGDIGTLDGALKALDERRRDYYKRTGGGEINRAEEELRDLTVRIHALEEQLRGVDDTRQKQDVTVERERALQEQHAQMSAAWRTLPGPEAGRMLSAQIAASESTCAALRGERDRIRARFGEAVPTAADIARAEEAAMRHQEAEARQCAVLKQQQETEAFFRRPTDESELARMRRVLYGKVPSLLPAILLLLLTVAFAVGAVVIHIALLAGGVLTLALAVILLLARQRTLTVTAEVKKIIASYPTVSKDVHLAFEEICRNFANSSLQNAQKKSGTEVDFADRDSEYLQSFFARFTRNGEHVSFASLRSSLLELQVAEQRLCDEIRRTEALSKQKAAFEASYDAQARDTLEQSLNDTQKQLDELRREQHLLAAEKQRMEELSVEHAALVSRLSEVKEHKASCESEHRIICLTMDYLKEAARRLTAKYKAKTEEGFDRYMRTLGACNRTGYQLTTAFELHMDEAGTYRPMEAYSRGTKDLYYLALRLGLIDALYDKEQPFLLLDDPFSALDDAHLTLAKQLLRELGRDRQVLYFTCTEHRVP